MRLAIVTVANLSGSIIRFCWLELVQKSQCHVQISHYVVIAWATITTWLVFRYLRWDLFSHFRYGPFLCTHRYYCEDCVANLYKPILIFIKQALAVEIEHRNVTDTQLT